MNEPNENNTTPENTVTDPATDTLAHVPATEINPLSTEMPPNVTDTTHTDLPSESLPVEPSFFVRNKTTLIAALLALLILGGAGGYYLYNTKLSKGPVVAMVNDEKIYQKDYDKRIAFIEQSAAAQGQEINTPELKKLVSTQALEMLINDALFLSAAQRAGYTATDEAVQKELDTLIIDAGSAEKFQEDLIKYQLTEAELRENIKKRVMTEQYLREKTAYYSVDVPDEEITSFYKTISAQNKDVPKLEEIKEQIAFQLQQQKQQQVLDEELAKLKGEAKIITKAL